MLSIVCLLCRTGLMRGQNPISRRQGPHYQAFKDPGGRFELDYPRRIGSCYRAGGSRLAIFEQQRWNRNRCDRSSERLAEPLRPSEIATTWRDAEIDGLKERAADGQGLQYASCSRPRRARRRVIRSTRRPGKQGLERGHPLLDSLLASDLFRVDGVVPEKPVAKFEPMHPST